MATAWELLLTYSTAPPASTAWEHLNSQEGGGGGTGATLFYEELNIEVQMADIEIQIDQPELEILIDQEDIIIQVEDDEIVIEVE